MDELSIRVLRLLHWPNEYVKDRPTYWSIAEALTVPPSTVKRHLTSLIEGKILSGISVVPEINTFGLTRTLVLAKCKTSTVEKIIQNFEIFDSVLHVYRTIGPDVILDMVHPGDLQRRLSVIRRICGNLNGISTFDYADNSNPLSKRDLMIFRILSDNPFARIHDITEMTGISRNITSRSLLRMSQEKQIRFEPLVNGYNLSNGVLGILVLEHEESNKDRVVGELTKMFNKRIVWLNRDFKGMMLCTFHTENFEHINRIGQKMAEISGRGTSSIIYPFTKILNRKAIFYNLLEKGVY